MFGEKYDAVNEFLQDQCSIATHIYRRLARGNPNAGRLQVTYRHNATALELETKWKDLEKQQSKFMVTVWQKMVDQSVPWSFLCRFM